MDSARRLACTEQAEEPGEAGMHAGRRRQSSQHPERPEHERDDEVRELLQDVVVPRRLALREAQQEMITDRAGNCRHIEPRRYQIAPEVAAQQRLSGVGASR